MSGNRLLSINEVAASLKVELDQLTPAQRAWWVYATQVTLGGFPRDPDEEARLIAALEA